MAESGGDDDDDDDDVDVDVEEEEEEEEEEREERARERSGRRGKTMGTSKPVGHLLELYLTRTQ